MKKALVVIAIVVGVLLVLCLICAGIFFMNSKNTMNNTNSGDISNINDNPNLPEDLVVGQNEDGTVDNTSSSTGMGISLDTAMGDVKNIMSFKQSDGQNGLDGYLGIDENGVIVTTVGPKEDLVQIAITVVPDSTQPGALTAWQSIYGEILSNVFGANATTVQTWMEQNNSTIAANQEEYVTTEIDGELVKYGVFTITSGEQSIRLVIEKPGSTLFY